jgi:Xaa-Pro aminopeptidase
VLVVDKNVVGADKEMLGFDTLTFAPIDQRLIKAEMLSDAERKWLDDYHGQVLALIGPQLEGEDKTWLEAQCAPLAG